LGKLRVLSGADVCRILEEHAFTLVRQRGSHAVMQMKSAGSTITVPVPLHDELRRSTLLSVIRQSGVPRSAFESSS